MLPKLADRDDDLTAPFHALRILSPAVSMQQRADGTILLRDPRPIVAPERTIITYLRRWSDEAPDRTMIAARGLSGEWVRVSYREMRAHADAIGQWLLDHGVTAGRTILILSGNSLEHAMLTCGAMTIGAIVAPISPAYSLHPSAYGKLRAVFDTVAPQLVFVQDAGAFAGAIAALDAPDVAVVAVTPDESNSAAVPFATLLSTKATDAVEQAYRATGPDTVAKILFSSGSTGWPKGVINTQRMMCLNQAMHDTLWDQEENEGPYDTLNWMPWNHTMAGNGLFNRSLRQGGTYYIDDGRPLPGEFERTIANLREIAPYSYSDVPAGFAMLATALEADNALCALFFSKLVFLQYAGASLPHELWERFQRLSVSATGRRMPFLTGYGCTEAGPSITQVYWALEGSGYIGVPMPGVVVKLIPVGDSRYELRAAAPNITPGYLGQDALYAACVDEEGFYSPGDAVTFVDRADPVKGLRFASRVAEDFKLLTGTFVAVGLLRAKLVGALMPLARDVVITGHDKPFVGAMIWPDIAACRALLGAAGEGLDDDEVARAPAVAAAVREMLAARNRASPASSMRIDRAVLLDEPPCAEANEITEKGYVNQRRVLERRADIVDRLYSATPDAAILLLN